MTKNSHTSNITPSKEDYLKVILQLSVDGVIHSTDIATALGISKASVSRMMKVLKDEGYITKEKYGTVTLTENGRKVAVYVRKRHDLLKLFLADVLGVEDTVAKKDACRMEHVISLETAEKLNQRLQKLSERVKTN